METSSGQSRVTAAIFIEIHWKFAKLVFDAGGARRSDSRNHSSDWNVIGDSSEGARSTVISARYRTVRTNVVLVET